MYIIVGILLVGAYHLGRAQGIHSGRYQKDYITRDREAWIKRERFGM
jgi:hypothetical protein